MFKIATLIKRKAGTSVDDFQEHLLTRYAPLMTDGSGLRRYVRPPALTQGYRKGEQPPARS